jgi:DNA modification methylase
MILCGDSLEVLKTLEANSIDSVVTDPPYGLSFMGKHWDYDVPQVELWREVYRVLKPGGHLLSFAGTRTQHRMAVNIEDAGFEIRDMIAWVYGSGFPKSLNIGKAVDKIQGNERDFISENYRGKNAGKKSGIMGQTVERIDIVTKGNSPWEGWGTALKPSWESLTVARKAIEHRTETEYNTNICQTLLASTAKQISMLNLSEPKEGLSIAQWIAEKNISTLGDLSEAMGILQFYTTENTNLNIVLSWLNILAENWIAMNISTISTKLNTITELKILDSLEWVSILENIIPVKDNQIDGWSADVYNAISLLNALELKLKHTLEHSVEDNATFLAGLEVLRPKLDPIVLARKPLGEKTIAANVLKWGTGGLNIDGSRITTTENLNGGMYSGTGKAKTVADHNWGFQKRDGEYTQPTGRFPANLIHDGSDEVVGLFPDSKSTGGQASTPSGFGEFGGGTRTVEKRNPGLGDSGSAARFFYCAKSSKSERNKGLEGFEDGVSKKYSGGIASAVNSDPHGMSGGGERLMKNHHPTVKPVRLMQYLVKLVTPKGGTVLDPFTGSGTTGIACKLEGFEFIGIEREQEYVDIAQARIEAWEPDKQETLL